MIYHAVEIALSALSLLADSEDTNATRYRRVLGVHIGERADRENVVGELLSHCGTHFRNVRRAIVSSLLGCDPCGYNYGERALVLARDGIVVYPTMLLEPSADQRKALSWKVKPGSIRFENQAYEVIEEEVGWRQTLQKLDDSLIKPLNLYTTDESGKTIYNGLKPRSDWQYLYTGCHLIGRGDGVKLAVMTKLRFRDLYFESDQSLKSFQKGNSTVETFLLWSQAMEELATARVLSESDQVDYSEEEEIASKLSDRSVLETTCWADQDLLHKWNCLSACPRHETSMPHTTRTPQNTIICTRGDTMLRLSSLSTLNENPAWHVIMANGANLVRAMEIAEAEVPVDNRSVGDSRGARQKWAIIM